MFSAVDDKVRHRRVIVDRVGIRHAGNGREATGHGRAPARSNVFLVLLAGLPQVGVDVDEAGCDPGSFSIEHLGSSGIQSLTDGSDPAVFDQ